MSLCAQCFEAGDHTGHDYNMFHSGAGGACDCGDSSVMAAPGICPDHSEVDSTDEPNERSRVPSQLVAPAQPVITRVLYRLLYEMRRKFLASHAIRRIRAAEEDMDNPRSMFETAELGMGEGFNQMVELLTHMAMNSSALQDVMTTALVASLNEAEKGFGDNTLHEESREELDEVNALIKVRLSTASLSYKL